ADDAEVNIARDALTSDAVGGRYPAFGADRGALPVIGALFSMDTSGVATARDGVLAFQSSRALILPGCGVKNVGEHGCYSRRGSSINAVGSIFSGAGAHGYHARHVALLDCRDGDATNAAQLHQSSGVYAYDTASIAARGVDASDSGYNGIAAEHNSMI